MFSKLFSSSPFKTFYIVFAYIFIFSLWWAYLLYDKNETAFAEKIELDKIRFEKENSNGDYFSTSEYLGVYSKYERQKLMIAMEGTVFIVLLLIGFFRVRKVFLEEIKLADRQRNFMLSITHELKSPLSAIKLSLQTLGKRKLEPDKSEKLIANSLLDLDRLESLVDNILFAAKIERDYPGFMNEDVNVSEIVSQAAERFSQNKKDIAIQTEVQPDVYLRTDVIAFTSVITNLIENAIKYSEPNTAINIKLKQSASNVLLSVADKGIGIADEEKRKVFDKFYRIGNEDTRKTKGTGLGLYIVKRFVELYKGEISIENNAGGGTVFKLKFSIGE